MNQSEKTIATALAVIIGLALLSSMTSCSTSQAVYRLKDQWYKAPTQSQVTGYTYKLK